jgi:phenylacetate-coenzyme A ligase PaaK-like adenylate-forming protein
LLTNLANQVQPLIRYDLGDSLTFLGQACRCGSSFPAVTIEGRCDEVIAFQGKRGRVQLLPLALVTVLEDEANAINFQLIARNADTLELRLDLSQSSAALDVLRATCHRVLSEYLNRCGLNRVVIVDGRCSPVRDARSGKVRRVINACAS